MASTKLDFDDDALKQVVKEALSETLHEHRQLWHEVFAEVLEDFALAEAIREGRQTKKATRKEVFRVLQSKQWGPASAIALHGICKKSRTRLSWIALGK